MTIQNEQEFLASYDRRDYDAPLLTVDMAIFSVLNGQLQVLLIKRPFQLKPMGFTRRFRRFNP